MQYNFRMADGSNLKTNDHSNVDRRSCESLKYEIKIDKLMRPI